MATTASSNTRTITATPPVLASPTATRDLHHLALPPPHERPAAAVPRHSSDPDLHAPLRSPLRHHRRTPSIGRKPIKETLDAELSYEDDEDGGQGLRVNQYNLKQEIGRGSFGAVHLAVDQEGQEYAVKEFSKSRLRKRSQSAILRRPHASRRFLNPNGGPGNGPSPFGHKRSASEIHREREAGDPLYLIREEIAILKKLDHENVVSLIEVLDDPEGDSIYMVMEMCEKGVIMKIGLEEHAEPYEEEKCRLWFRDMILGIEYLHSQGIIHRDLKPDNLLLSRDDVLKIVDFGVSEMFEKRSPMLTAKSSGSPAFLPPELCYAGHGDVSGTAADIWSMGVSLYCLVYGRLPFSHSGIMELYEAIKSDSPPIPDETNPTLKDLFARILDKNPATRIRMPELRQHAWVTNDGTDPLLPTEENTADLIQTTEHDVADAISSSIRNVMTVVRAVRKFKARLLRRAAEHKAALTRAYSPSNSNTSTAADEATLPQLSSTRSKSVPTYGCGEVDDDFGALTLAEKDGEDGDGDGDGDRTGRLLEKLQQQHHHLPQHLQHHLHHHHQRYPSIEIVPDTD